MWKSKRTKTWSRRSNQTYHISRSGRTHCYRSSMVEINPHSVETVERCPVSVEKVETYNEHLDPGTRLRLILKKVLNFGFPLITICSKTAALNYKSKRRRQFFHDYCRNFLCCLHCNRLGYFCFIGSLCFIFAVLLWSFPCHNRNNQTIWPIRALLY